MFDIGFWEVLVVAVLALVILGPERLPRAVRVAGFWLGRARGTYQSLRREMDREFQIQEMRKAGRSFDEELNQTFPSTLKRRPPEEEIEVKVTVTSDADSDSAPAEEVSEQDAGERKDA